MVYVEKKKNYSKCKCICDCGNIVVRDVYKLQHAKLPPSCGCSFNNSIRQIHAKNVDGQTFGRLTIIETLWDEKPRPKVRCTCSCGQEVVLDRNSVITGHTQSCGCLKRDRLREANTKDKTGFVSDYGVTVSHPSHKNAKGQMLWECICGYCGKHFFELPARIKNNHVKSCGCLVSSSTEDLISQYLDSLHIEYKRQFTYCDCLSKNNHKLRFDFAVMHGNEVQFLIEYDGLQHYEPVKLWGGEAAFHNRQFADALKNDYCQSHKIRLLRLPYYLSTDEIKKAITNIINP